MRKIGCRIACVSIMWIGCNNAASAFDLLEACVSATKYNANFLAAVAKNNAGLEEQVQGLLLRYLQKHYLESCKTLVLAYLGP